MTQQRCSNRNVLLAEQRQVDGTAPPSEHGSLQCLVTAGSNFPDYHHLGGDDLGVVTLGQAVGCQQVEHAWLVGGQAVRLADQVQRRLLLLLLLLLHLLLAQLGLLALLLCPVCRQAV